MSSSFVVLLFVLLCLSVVSSATSEHFVVTFAERTIDLRTQRAVHQLELTLRALADADDVLIGLEKEHLFFASVQSNGVELALSEHSTRSEGRLNYQLWRAKFAKKVHAGESVSVTVRAVFGHAQQPKPARITQSQKQLVEYTENVFVYSPYVIESQKTRVELASSRLEANTEVSPTEVHGDSILYGPYTDTGSFRFEALTVHFENNSPFLTFTSLVKEIEVSHWGNIAIEESYQLKHTGAALEGIFSRLDYIYGQTGNSVAGFTQYLPVGATDIYYRDEIGNVSTSRVFPTEKGVKFDIMPRFVLFGEWKIDFYTGYNLPADRFLSTADGVYVLDVPMATDSGDVLTDELEVRVILPEGAFDIELHTPFAVKQDKPSTRLTYLDYVGRPVLSFHKSRVVTEHNRNFQVTYRVTAGHMLQEPLLVIFAFLVLFLTTMLLVRLDFSLITEPANKK